MGHRLVGYSHTNNFFRDIRQEEIAEDKLANEFFGESAIKFVQGIIQRPPPKDAEQIEKLVREKTG